jgi:periplasmic copper chaperone A
MFAPVMRHGEAPAMRPRAPSRLLLAVLLLGPLLAAATAAQEFRAGSIKVTAPWSRATPASAKVGGGFMTITNAGKAPDRLVGGSTAVSGSLEIHEMHLVNGIMMMRHVNPGIALQPGATVVLKPFSHHLMLMDLKQPLRAGEKIKGVLVFEKAGPIEIEYDVVPMGSAGPGHRPNHHRPDHHRHEHK